jgi:hypothetical protein
MGDGTCDEINNWYKCDNDGGDCGYCFNNDWKGDNICDDENNDMGCDFDGGDCCGPSVDTTYCSDCKCIDPSK